MMLQSFRCFKLIFVIFYRIELFCVYRNAIGEIIVPPNDEEAVALQNVTLRCRSNIKTQFPVAWYHLEFGTDKYIELVYENGHFSNHLSDPNKYAISGNTSEGEFNLVISNVKLEDAGRYTCTDTSGSERRAELVVYESQQNIPSCLTNQPPDGFVGVNDCGITPDTIRMSCNVSYRGNLKPTLECKQGDETLSNADTKTSNSNMVSSIVLTAEEFRSPDFQCGVKYLNSNIESKFIWMTTVKVLDTTITSYNASCKESPIQPIDCAFKTSHQCSYMWKKSNSSWSSSGSILNLKSADQATVYICHAECFNDTKCSFTPALVAYTCDMNDKEKEDIQIIIVVIVVIFGILAATGVIVILLKRRRRHVQTAVPSEDVGL